jgi:hypothetical protein
VPTTRFYPDSPLSLNIISGECLRITAPVQEPLKYGRPQFRGRAQDDSLLKKGRLSNAFWDKTGQPHCEVVTWMKSDTVFEYLDGVDDPVLVDDFSYAWPQLMAIRSALAQPQA